MIVISALTISSSNAIIFSTYSWSISSRFGICDCTTILIPLIRNGTVTVCSCIEFSFSSSEGIAWSQVLGKQNLLAVLVLISTLVLSCSHDEATENLALGIIVCTFWIRRRNDTCIVTCQVIIIISSTLVASSKTSRSTAMNQLNRTVVFIVINHELIYQSFVCLRCDRLVSCLVKKSETDSFEITGSKDRRTRCLKVITSK